MKKNIAARLVRLIICIAVVAVIVGVGTATKFMSFEEFTDIRIDF